MKKIVILFCIVVAFSCESRQKSIPNIIIIFTDDQGYGDLGCFGSETIKTPHIDRLAESGMKFTDFLVAASVCTPSRAALLTGCYPNRISLPGVLFPDGAWGSRPNIGLNPDEETLAELLKQKGYTTAMAGKWHLGHMQMFLPLQHGFDHYFGIPYSNDMNRGNLPLMKDNEVLEIEPDQALLTKRYTEFCIEFINKQAGESPFFLYLAHTMPHIPIYASEQFEGKSEGGLYGDVIEEIDWSVGQIIRALDEKDVLDKTLVIFTSDNGPWLSFGNHGGNAGRLRGGKFDVFEGGFRVPCVMSWPGTIPEGKICDEMVTSMDLLPTICHITGAALPEKMIDGLEISLLLEGKEMPVLKDRYFFYYSNKELKAVRQGKWKYIKQLKYGVVTDPGNDGVNGTTENLEQTEALYFLDEDISESNNLIDKYPEVAEGLRKIMVEFDQSLTLNARPVGISDKKIE